MNDNINYYLQKIYDIFNYNFNFNNFEIKKFENLYFDFNKFKDIDIKELFIIVCELTKKQNLFVNVDSNQLNKIDNIIFIGDIHGDLFSLLKIILKYLNNSNLLVFLGDYVDRGKYSAEVIILIVLLKILYPENIILLAGNHEIYHIISFWPSDFWFSEFAYKYNEYITNFFDSLSICGRYEKILFLHGIPYFFKDLNDFEENINKCNKISDIFYKNKNIIKYILWGDIKPKELKNFIKRADFFYEEEEYIKIKSQLNFDYLIRGHQPDVKGFTFNKSCITLITSEFYNFSGLLKGNLILNLNKNKKIIEEKDIIYL
ncbi:MAG: serine/threonine protein phosphatase [Spirochaetes bacterium]|nr:serine/threonine protein phosphatase [Spirochaetota bacterium]